MTSRPSSTSPLSSSAASGQTPSIFWIAFGLVLPSLVTWVYFEWLASQPSAWQQAAYALGKTAQFVLPLLFWRAFQNGAWNDVQPDIQSNVHKPMYARSIGFGLATGLAIAALIVGLYHGLFKPMGLMEGPAIEARKKLIEMGLDDPLKLAGVAVFYSLIHAGLEEYYWRWFAFGALTRRTGVNTAALISSLGFMAHHVILLARYFSWTSPLTLLFSVGVAVGGMIWATLYRSTRTLAGSWLSHSLVDAAIFVVAFDLTDQAV